MEKQLGTKLFIRSKRSVAITDSGKELLPRAIEMVEIAENTAFRIRQIESGGGGSISIAALTTSSFVLARCLEAFSQKHPEIAIDITFNSGRSQVIAISDARFDIHFAVREMVPVGGNYDSIVSNSDNLCVVFPRCTEKYKIYVPSEGTNLMLYANATELKKRSSASVRDSV